MGKQNGFVMQLRTFFVAATTKWTNETKKRKRRWLVMRADLTSLDLLDLNFFEARGLSFQDAFT